MTAELAPYATPHGGTDTEVMLPGTRDRVRKGIPDNTQTSYQRAWRDFEAWCSLIGRTPLPCSPVTLADYTAYLCDRGLAPSTIEHDMYVIRKMHRLAGHPKGTPDSEPALLVLRGYRRDRAADGHRTKEAAPLTLTLLARVNAAAPEGTLVGSRDRFLLTLGVAVAARRSELSAFSLQDVRLDGDGDLRVYFRVSKTDRNAEGVERIVPPGDHIDTDPVGLYRAWIGALEARGVDVTDGALFRAVTQHDRLYRHHRLSGDAIDEVVRRAIRRAGVPGWADYSGHSMRAGYATTAAMAGVPTPIWAEFGRWDKDSPTPHKYVRIVSQKLDNPLRRMGF